MVHFSYENILVIGATSGLGSALSEKFIKEGKKIVIVGRREEKLKEFADKHGKSVLGYEVFDVTQLDKIPAFVQKVTKEYPDIDAVFLNSGVQRAFNFSKPETVDLSLIDQELTTNYTSYVHLVTAFLPFLLKKETKKTALIFTGSSLALAPLPRAINYSATKAALHHFIISLRYHLKDSKIQVLELMPPAVQTELHDEDKQPDFKGGREFGMPIDQYVDETWKALEEGNAYGEYPVGDAIRCYGAVEPGRKYILASMSTAPADV